MKNQCDNLRMFGDQLKCKDCGAVWDKNDDRPEQCNAADVPVAMKAFGPQPILAPAVRCAACCQDVTGLRTPHVCPAAATDSSLRCHVCDMRLAPGGKHNCPGVHTPAPGCGPAVLASNEPTRQATGLRFDLIPGDVMAEIARVFAEGAEKYGDYNWQKGRMTGDKDPINHALKHVLYYNSGTADGTDLELHLRHAIVNLMFELHYQINPDKYGDRFKGRAGKVRK